MTKMMKELLRVSGLVDDRERTGVDEGYWQAHRDSRKLMALEMDKEADARRKKELWSGRQGPPLRVTQGDSTMEEYASWPIPRMKTPDHDAQDENRRIEMLATKTISRKQRARLQHQEVATYVLPLTQRARARARAKAKKEQHENETETCGRVEWIIFHYRSLTGESKLMQVKR